MALRSDFIGTVEKDGIRSEISSFLKKELKKELIRELKASIDNVNEELEQCEEPEKRVMFIKMKRNLELTLQENLDRQQLFWVIPCSSFGSVESAFKTGSYTVKKVSQLDKAAVGDIAYLYFETTSYYGIRFKCCIVSIDDGIELELMHGYEAGTDTSFGRLKALGVRSRFLVPFRLFGTALRYMQSCDEKYED